MKKNDLFKSFDVLEVDNIKTWKFYFFIKKYVMDNIIKND